MSSSVMSRRYLNRDQSTFRSERSYVLVSIGVGLLLLSDTSAFVPTTISPHRHVHLDSRIPRLPSYYYRKPSSIDRHPFNTNSIHMISRRPYPYRQRSMTRRWAAVVTLPTTISTSSIYLTLLAIQFGIQPMLTKAYTPKDIIRSTVLLAQDFLRFVSCFIALRFSGNWHTAIHGWTWQGSLLAAGIPSLLYMVQNYFSLIAYQALPPVTFNILNQTKTLSAALCCYLILGRRQSPPQIVALFLLLLSALVIEKIIPIPGMKPNIVVKTEGKSEDEKVVTVDLTQTTTEEETKSSRVAAGVIPILIASFISGLAGAVSQRNLQVVGRDVRIFSMELSAISFLTMISTFLLGSPDGKEVWTYGIGKGWTWKTWIPVLTNAAGGIVVGLVTKHSGAVKKGFGLIFGLLLSGILQSSFLSDEGITSEQICGGILASISVWMHSSFHPSVT